MFQLIANYLWAGLPFFILSYAYQVNKLFKSYEDNIQKQDLIIKLLLNQVRDHVDYIEKNTCKKCKNNFKK